MITILIIEDEEKVAAFLKKGLQELGYIVYTAATGTDGLKMAGENSHDLLIVDVMLPGMNGIDLCREIREQQPSALILMLTALGLTEDKVAGLRAGADDYLVKPFHFEELTARIEALLRRRQNERVSLVKMDYAGLSLDLETKSAMRNGDEIALTAKEFALLKLFLGKPNKLFSRREIAEQVWGIGFDTGTNVIDVYVNYLRNKVDKPYSPKLIHTVVGMGYILKDDPAE
ncbi:MAG: response regulator transcription factor [Mucilaginibacter polytrichastri]|nr:response regulator transcription factor [Mucilaginibacter polytrichastri]